MIPPRAAWVLGMVWVLIAWAPAFAGPADGRDELSPTSRAHLIEPETTPDLDLRVQLRLPTWREVQPSDVLAQVSLAPEIPGQVAVRYRGFQGFVLKRLTSRYRKLFSSQLSQLEEDYRVTDAQLRALRQAMADAAADMRAGGRWWERPWYYSLPEAAGGAPAPVVHEVGARVEVLRLGPVVFTNELRARVHVLELGVSSGCVYRDLQDTQAIRDFARLLREDGDEELEPGERPDAAAQQDELPPVSARVDLSPPRAAYRGVAFDFKLRPELRARIDSSFLPDTRVGLRAVVEMRLGAQERLVSRLEARVSYRQTTGELVAGVELALLSW